MAQLLNQQIQLCGITKSYKQNTILDNIELKIEAAEIYTLIGKNGVGKSTLLELLVGLNTPDSGKILYNNETVHVNAPVWKRQIGAALNIDHLIDTLSIEEYLTLLCHIYGLEKNLTISRAGSLIDYFFDQDEAINKPIKHYSSGMKKKTLLCAAFIHNPKIILLDEPFTFLDPAACSRLCDFLLQQKAQGKIILLSSHDLLYIDKVSTRIGVLDDKKLILDDSYQNFKAENDFFKENTMLKKVMNYDSKLLSALAHNFN